MRIAAQCYTIREYTKSEAEIADSQAKIAEIGYKSIQVSGFKHFDARFIAGTARRLGLEIFGTHTPLTDILQNTDRVIEEHGIMGAKYVGLGWHKIESGEDCDLLLDKLQKPIDKITSAGLKFVYHNHEHELKAYEDSTFLEYMLKQDERVGLLADLYWVEYAGVDVVDFLNRNKARIECVHLKDMKIDGDKKPFAEVFEGVMDYARIIDTCMANGVKWAAVEQDESDDAFKSLRKSYDNIVRRYDLG